VSEVIPTTVSPTDLLALHAPTPADERKTRPDRATWQHKATCPGKGCPSQRDPSAHVQLTYVDARYVQKVLDETVGPANWQSEFSMADGGKVSCRIGIRVEFGDGPEWVYKGDGAGATDIEGDKGSFSDAFKRAGVAWGIARDLYGDDAPAAPVSAAAALAVAPAAPQQPVVAATGQIQRTEYANDQAPPLPPGTVRYQDIESSDKCPDHGLPWTIKAGGTSRAGKAYSAFYKCDGRGGDGSYCKKQPPKAWADAHPIAG
jgi:hypothetical protein